MGPTSTILVLAVIVAIPMFVLTVVVPRRNAVLGRSTAMRTQASELMQTGRKARATIVDVQPTGMVVNDINMQCIVHFRLEPLDGGQPLEAQKKMLVSRTAMPRIGELWPSWFDPADPMQFIVGQPTAITPNQVGMFREFGIPHPLDRQLP